MDNKQTNAKLLKKIENYLFLESGEPNDKNTQLLELLHELFATLSGNALEEKEEQHAESDFLARSKTNIDKKLAGLYRIRVFSKGSLKYSNWGNARNYPYAMELASDRFYEILGISRDTFSEESFHIEEFVHREDKKSFVKANEVANNNFSVFQWEGRLVVKGEIKWVRLESLPHKLENSDVVWTGVLTDMTEKVKMEEILKATQHELEDVLIGANIGTLEWNIQTGKIKFNKIWAKNLGYSSAELKIGLILFGSKGWKMITHPDDIPYAESMLERHFSGELPHYSVEVRMKHKKGHWIWVRQEGEVKTWTEDGKPLLMFGTHSDITSRKHAEEQLNTLNEELEKRVAQRTEELERLNAELKDTEQKLKTVSDFTSDWEYWKSPENKIIFMSPSVESITGYTIGEFEKHPDLIDEIIYERDLHIWKNHIDERGIHTGASNNSLELVFRIVKKDGEIRWIAHICRLIHIEGKYLGIRVSNRDITDKMAIEKELLGLTISVEEHERNRLARELHDGMGPLLSTIKLYFQWLADTHDAEKQKMITEKGNYCIEMAIQTARELAQGLSSQQLINSGYVVAIQDFVHRINDTNKLKIDFESYNYDRLPEILETTLYRISAELIKNTLTYAQASSVKMKVDFDSISNNVLFFYTDNGVGFDWETLKLTNKGLGLMNIQQRIQVLKGNICIQSKLGEGVNVQIELPVEKSDF